MDICIYKVGWAKDHVEGIPIPEQPADLKTPAFIHACNQATVSKIIAKFYGGQPEAVVVYQMKKSILEEAGFTVVWEPANPTIPAKPYESYYWHLYRKAATDTVPAKCIHLVVPGWVGVTV
jgi:uncharacterized protein (DUF952 family)